MISVKEQQMIELFGSLSNNPPEHTEDNLPFTAYIVLVMRDESRYASAFKAQYKAALSLILAEYTDDQIYEIFWRYISQDYASRKDLKAYVRVLITKAVKKYAPLMVKETFINNAICWAHNRFWLGESGDIDRMAFIACCEKALRETVLDFRASRSQIAAMINCDFDSTEYALGRLVSQGLIIPHRTSEPPHHYSFNIEQLVKLGLPIH